MALGPMTRRTSIALVFLLAAAGAARAQSPDAAVQPSDPPRTAWSSPALHVTLGSAFVGLQTLDVVTTLRGLQRGTAVEANPLMGSVVANPAALIALKSGLTAATLVSMHGLGRSHPKAAVLTMIALNAAGALVVRSNFRFAVGN
jgi:hypothetical protein